MSLFQSFLILTVIVNIEYFPGNSLAEIPRKFSGIFPMGICGNSQESFTGTSSENVDSNSEEFLITYSLEFLETHSQEFLVTHSWKFHVKWRISLNQIRGISHIFFLKDGSEVNFYFLSIRMQRQKRFSAEKKRTSETPTGDKQNLKILDELLRISWEEFQRNSQEFLETKSFILFPKKS